MDDALIAVPADRWTSWMPAPRAAGVPAGVLEDRLRGDQLPAVLRCQRAGGNQDRISGGVRQSQPADAGTGAARQSDGSAHRPHRRVVGSGMLPAAA